MEIKQTIYLNYATSNVGLTTWVQLDPVINNGRKILEIFDSGGSVMELGIGPVGSEKRICLIMPGGNVLPVTVPLETGNRLSVRAVSVAVTTGLLAINMAAA